MKTLNKSHFILIKRSGYDVNQRLLSATQCANKLLDAKLWPLWEGTRCKDMIKPGHKVLIYLAGAESDCKMIIASAEVLDVVDWSLAHKRQYPLMLDGVPCKTLMLGKVQYFNSPVDVREKLDDLSFTPQNRSKWGVVMMGGVRSLKESDYRVLSH